MNVVKSIYFNCAFTSCDYTANNIDKSRLSSLSLAKEALNFGHKSTIYNAMSKERELTNKLTIINTFLFFF